MMRPTVLTTEFVVVIVCLVFTVIDSHVCMLKENPDPLQGGVVRWSMSSAERCVCQGVVISSRVFVPTHFTLEPCTAADNRYEADITYWFVDDPRQLTTPKNWNKETLDQLLNRTRYCDTEAPTFHFCPAKLVITEFNTSIAGVISGATDNWGYKPTVTCIMVSDYVGESGQIGNITCKAVDESENSATCTFAVSAIACNEYLGMKNGDIPDGNIKASSSSYNSAKKARLDFNGNWIATTARPWIQADIGYQTYLSGVVTQGGNHWMTTLSVSTFVSSTSDPQMFIEENGELKIFTANTDAPTKVVNYFPEPVFARIVRITGESKKGPYWNLRFELLGCKMDINN